MEQDMPTTSQADRSFASALVFASFMQRPLTPPPPPSRQRFEALRISV
jgi:MYND finger/Sel1 repeat